MGTGSTVTDRRASARLGAVVAATLLVGVLVGIADAGPRLRLDTFGLVVVAFAIAGARTIRLDIGRQRCTMTAAPVVLAALVGSLPAVALGLAAAIGEATTLVPLRIGARKLVVNLGSRWTAAVVGSAAFTVLEPLGSGVTATAARSCAAVLVYTAANAMAVSAAMAAATGRPVVGVLRQTAAASGVIAVAGASLGGTARALAAASPLALALLAPMVLVIWQASRAAVAQRDQHLRLVELYRAVAETVPLTESDAALTTMCEQTAGLVAADAALVAMAWPGAPASAAAMQGSSARALAPEVADIAVDLAPTGQPHLVPAGLLPSELVAHLGDRDVLVAGHQAPDGSRVCVLAAVALGRERALTAKLETLGAYASHVAVIATNFRLYTEVQDALRHQLDLNQRKDEFVATLSHELRTPLTVTIGALESITRYQDRMSAEVRQQMLADASSQAHRLRGLIDDLLTVAAGPTRVALEPVAVRDLLTAIRLSVAPAIASRTTVSGSVDSDLVVYSHLRSIERILTNLISNAAKYGGDGPIEVVVEAEHHLVVRVVDHGPGIPSELVDQAFDRFVQLDQSDSREEGGVGLGLYLCRKLADEIGAVLTLHTTPGGGATFALTLAVARDAAEGPSTPDLAA